LFYPHKDIFLEVNFLEHVRNITPNLFKIILDRPTKFYLFGCGFAALWSGIYLQIEYGKPLIVKVEAKPAVSSPASYRRIISDAGTFTISAILCKKTKNEVDFFRNWCKIGG
jgi:hypothetical protein